ncbi:lethal giant larvae like, C-terminal-domain-containing protein [Cerioporus squamosus]|nr:lethal giant larvae like, C-terminal-domain-containing protein [Cerioporus squamosus]
MFTSQAVKALPDLSFDVSGSVDWQAGPLRTVHRHLDITAIATEPTTGLFAVGTAHGHIYLHGSPGVECELKLIDPPGLRITFLQFAATAFKLLAIDEHNRLHVFDLASEGRPKLQRIAGLGHPVNALVTSPSHTHAFIALANGEVKTYDLLCLRISQYVIPNLWKMHEEMSLSNNSGAPLDMVVDMLIHPRDLNLLFVAYEGGVILLDLKEQRAVRTFTLTLPPGAPGGTGYHAKDILQPRHLQVTTLAIHPSGHLLAVGYVDGTIGFWSLEDEDKPLTLRTIDSPEEEDLSTVDTAKLESLIAAAHQHPPEPPREPIFKLAWSGFPNSADPRGGDTVLTVLGGITIDSPPCVITLLLPPLQPPATPTPTSPKGQPTMPFLYPETRAALCASLSVRNVYTYGAPGTVQDFLLFPRSSPHFSGTYDPSAILVVSESDAPDARVCEAFEFPPPAFAESSKPPARTDAPLKSPVPEGDGLEPDDALEDELEMTLQSMAMSDDPSPARLPPALWNVLGEYIIKVDKHSYDTLVRDKLGNIDGEVPFPIKGGLAWAEDSEGLAKYTKQQPNRILISHLRNLTIHFLDLSSQLLNGTSPEAPLATSFPSPIPRLTIELAPILIDPSLGLTGSTDYDPRLAKQRIHAVHFAPESLECVTVLRSGAVILHRIDVPADAASFGQQTLPDEELVSLSHLRARKGLRYSPVFAIRPSAARGQVTSCALSDVGFLAVAYASGLLLIIDLRGPRVLLRSTSRPHGGSSFLHRHSESEPIQRLTWACCKLSTDAQHQMRLLCTADSGQTTIYNLNLSQSGLRSSFVLDAKKGYPLRADRKGLASVLQPGQAADSSTKCIWVSAGAKGARCMLNVNGERVARTEWGSKVGTVVHVEVVGHLDSYALVAYTSLGLALVYSLPHLEQITTLELHPAGLSLSDPPRTEESGDYIVHNTFPVPSGSSTRLISSTELHTLFINRRAGLYAPPLVNLAHGRGAVPAQPQPVSLGPASVMGSVLGYLGSLSITSAGDQIDALLAGPDRPIPKPPSMPVRPMVQSAETGAGASSDPSQSSVSATAAGMSAGVGDLYNRLGTAITERGEMLGDLQESLDHLGQGSKNMVAQAKRLAAQQTAKGWFGF